MELNFLPSHSRAKHELTEQTPETEKMLLSVIACVVCVLTVRLCTSQHTCNNLLGQVSVCLQPIAVLLFYLYEGHVLPKIDIRRISSKVRTFY